MGHSTTSMPELPAGSIPCTATMTKKKGAPESIRAPLEIVMVAVQGIEPRTLRI